MKIMFIKTDFIDIYPDLEACGIEVFKVIGEEFRKETEGSSEAVERGLPIRRINEYIGSGRL